MSIGPVDKLEKAYGTEVPEVYRKLIESGEHTKYKTIELSGYVDGTYKLDFTDDLLVDVVELGMQAGIDDMDDVPWEDDFASWVPIASLSRAKDAESRMFLVLNVKTEAVALFHHDGWQLSPVNDSFDAFLKELPKATSSIPAPREDDEDDE